MEMISLDDKIKYIGYKSENLERFRARALKPFEEEISKYYNLGNNSALIEMRNLSQLSLYEVKKLAQKFYKKNFKLNNVNVLSPQNISQKNMKKCYAVKQQKNFMIN